MNPLFHTLFQTTRYLNRELNYALKEHGLFVAQWTVLYCIEQHGEMKLTQIWQYLNVEAPTITRTVNRLEEIGWLTTHAGADKREKIVRLSDMAIVNFPGVKETIVEFESRFLEGLSEEEQGLLLKLLKKMNHER